MASPTFLPASFVSGAVLTAAQMNDLRGAFRVLQVVSATTSTIVNTSVTTFVDAGLTATITPQSATSKVLCVTFNACAKTNGNTANAVRLKVLRGATQVNEFRYGLLTNTAIDNVGSISMMVLDSPATTSATIYKVQIANEVAAATAQYAANSVQCQMILMEISA